MEGRGRRGRCLAPGLFLRSPTSAIAHSPTVWPPNATPASGGYEGGGPAGAQARRLVPRLRPAYVAALAASWTCTPVRRSSAQILRVPKAYPVCGCFAGTSRAGAGSLGDAGGGGAEQGTRSVRTGARERGSRRAEGPSLLSIHALGSRMQECTENVEDLPELTPPGARRIQLPGVTGCSAEAWDSSRRSEAR